MNAVGFNPRSVWPRFEHMSVCFGNDFRLNYASFGRIMSRVPPTTNHYLFHHPPLARSASTRLNHTAAGYLIREKLVTRLKLRVWRGWRGGTFLSLRIYSCPFSVVTFLIGLIMARSVLVYSIYLVYLWSSGQFARTCNASYMDTLVLAAQCFWFHCSFLQASLPPLTIQSHTHPEILTLWGFAVTRYLVFTLALCGFFSFVLAFPSTVGSLVGKRERTRLIAFTHSVSCLSCEYIGVLFLFIHFFSPNVWTLPVVLQGGRAGPLELARSSLR